MSLPAADFATWAAIRGFRRLGNDTPTRLKATLAALRAARSSTLSPLEAELVAAGRELAAAEGAAIARLAAEADSVAKKAQGLATFAESKRGRKARG